jgi:molybdopterin converting factor small subunit
VQIYVNDEHVRFRQDLDTPLRDGDQVYVTPLVMGG